MKSKKENVVEYAIVHDGKVFTPDGKDIPPIEEVEENNLKIDKDLLDLFAKQPNSFWGYIKPEEREVTTFLGVHLGTVKFGNWYRNGFGGFRRRYFRLYATNGCQYVGVEANGYTSGNLVRFRKVKPI